MLLQLLTRMNGSGVFEKPEDTEMHGTLEGDGRGTVRTHLTLFHVDTPIDLLPSWQLPSTSGVVGQVRQDVCNSMKEVNKYF